MLEYLHRKRFGSKIFGPNLFPYKYSQHFSNLVILHLPAYEDGTGCSETSAYKIQTPGNYPAESIEQVSMSFMHVT